MTTMSAADHLQLTLPINTSDRSSTDTDSDSCISEEDCHTPKSPKDMIPPVLCCPPAPRKPLRRISCKRKLEFFEAVARDEVDSFFTRAEESINGAKRRCLL